MREKYLQALLLNFKAWRHICNDVLRELHLCCTHRLHVMMTSPDAQICGHLRKWHAPPSITKYAWFCVDFYSSDLRIYDRRFVIFITTNLRDDQILWWKKEPDVCWAQPHADSTPPPSWSHHRYPAPELRFSLGTEFPSSFIYAFKKGWCK